MAYCSFDGTAVTCRCFSKSSVGSNDKAFSPSADNILYGERLHLPDDQQPTGSASSDTVAGDNHQQVEVETGLYGFGVGPEWAQPSGC